MRQAEGSPVTAPDLIEIDLPLIDGLPPLTANQRLHWAEKARRVRLVRQAVGWRASTIGRVRRVTVRLYFQPQDRRRRDASNLVPTQKPAVDGLVDAGVVPDDTAEWVEELMPMILAPSSGERRLWIAVEVER